MGAPSLSYLSPATYAALRACPLRLDFMLRRPRSVRRRSAFSVLGDVAQAALASAVSERAWEGDWRVRLDELWAAEFAVAAGELKAVGDRLGDVDPRRWPEYELRRARLTRVFEDIAGLVKGAGPRADIFPEQNLSGAGGRIRGRADLIVRSDVLHVVVDYKTGYVSDAGGDVNADYLAQMQLYGYLEKERSGSWPTEAYLSSFAEPAIRVRIDPGQAAGVVRNALRELEAFNERATHGGQPARPAPLTCRHCRFAARCGPFWDACSPDWSQAVLAVRGSVRKVVRGQLPIINIELQAAAGSLRAGPVIIRQISVADFPWVTLAEPRQNLAAVGLLAEPSRDTYRLPPQGRLWIDGLGTEVQAGGDG